MSNEVELCKEFNELKSSKEALAKQTKEINDQIFKCQSKIIDSLVESGKTSTGFIEGVGNISLVKSVFPSITAGNLPGFIDSIRDTDDFGMVKETIAAPTLKTFLKEKIQEYTDMYVENEDLVDVHLAELAEKGIMPKPSDEDGEEEGILSPAKAASRYWGLRGVRVFEEVKLSHRDRVKPK